VNIVVVVNQKGGVGKTTTTANLAYAVAMLGHKVSAIDFDPQGHLTAYLGFASQNDTGVGDVILNKPDVAQNLLKSDVGLQLLPSGQALKNLAGVSGQDLMTPEMFAERLRSLFHDQEFVFIDCPPASGVIMDYALSAADRVLVPVAADYLALRGLSDLVVTLRNYSRTGHGHIPQTIVVTRFHGKRRLCHEVRDKLVEYFPDQILATPIRETAALAESPGFGKTVFEYKKSDYGSVDYLNLANDFIHARYM
jgi:chromosome partitioning protein